MFYKLLFHLSIITHIFLSFGNSYASEQEKSLLEDESFYEKDLSWMSKQMESCKDTHPTQVSETSERKPTVTTTMPYINATICVATGSYLYFYEYSTMASILTAINGSFFLTQLFATPMQKYFSLKSTMLEDVSLSQTFYLKVTMMTNALMNLKP